EAPCQVTRIGYHMVMKEVKIAELKARLSEHLRAVRQGHPVTVLDRDRPIARIVPYTVGTATLQVRKPAPGAPRFCDVKLPPPLRPPSDIVTLLLEDRDSDR
ncbi:MAG: type II toxin-antitoxin system Phd/YefM family antitoxin, partial [Thermoanaerobaculia bacterium]